MAKPAAKRVAIGIAAVAVVAAMGAGAAYVLGSRGGRQAEQTDAIRIDVEQDETPGADGDVADVPEVTDLGQGTTSVSEEQVEADATGDAGTDAATDEGTDAGIDEAHEPSPNVSIYGIEPEQTAQTVTMAATGVPLTTDDLPAVSQFPNAYGADDIRAAIVAFMDATYPDEEITNIALMGNGYAKSQQTEGDDYWATYLITTANGVDIGVMCTCSDLTAPYVNEASMLLVNDYTGYDVDSGQYITLRDPSVEVPEY